MSGDRRADEDAVCTTEHRDGTRDDLADVLMAEFSGLRRNQQRMELEIKRVGLDVQRLDATVQLMGTSVGALGSQVRQLGGCVRDVATKLNLSRKLMDFHLHTIMNQIGVPPVDTFHSGYLDGQPTGDRVSATPGEPGD